MGSQHHFSCGSFFQNKRCTLMPPFTTAYNKRTSPEPVKIGSMTLPADQDTIVKDSMPLVVVRMVRQGVAFVVVIMLLTSSLQPAVVMACDKNMLRRNLSHGDHDIWSNEAAFHQDQENRELVLPLLIPDVRNRCGHEDPTPEEEAQDLQAVDEFIEQHGRHMLERMDEEEIVIRTWVHDIRAYVFPTVTEAQIRKQIDVLNDAFAGTGFRFELEGMTCNTNMRWWFSAIKSAAERQMKRRLRHGTVATLNVYLVGGAQKLGWANLPSGYYVDPNDDGVAIVTGTLPGGSLRRNYNDGMTLVHEVGHWLGLYHTFRGACDDADGVDDTPAHSAATMGCPDERDSCPGQEGMDPIHNFMNYSFDECMTEFTPGQIERMKMQWMTYRHSEYVPPEQEVVQPNAMSFSRTIQLCT